MERDRPVWTAPSEMVSSKKYGLLSHFVDKLNKNHMVELVFLWSPDPRSRGTGVPSSAPHPSGSPPANLKGK